MALKIQKVTYEYQNEYRGNISKEESIPNCYVRITDIIGSKNKCYLNCTFYDENIENIVMRKTYEFTPSVSEDAPNFIQQGYEYLKTLPEFADAIDC